MIQRYLADILYLNDELPEDNNVLYLIREELEEEGLEEESGNNDFFWEYLKGQQAAVVLISPIGVRDIEKVIGSTPTSELIAIARPHERENPVKKFYARPEYWKQDLKEIAHDISFSEYLILRVLNIEFIAKLLDKVKYGSIETVKELEGTKESQDKEVGTQQSKLPPDTKWQDITIRFIDNDDNVEISTKSSSYMANYQEMGFENRKTKRPNLQWKFLQLLAIQKGELRWKTDLDTSVKERNSFKKKVQSLSDTLENYFQIKEPLFYSYRKEKAYKIKINLIRPSDRQESTRQQKDKIGSEVKEYLDENAPSVYEEPNKYDDNY